MTLHKKCALFLALVFLLAVPSEASAAITTYYEEVQTRQITRGLVYESKSMVTSSGLLDVYTLKISLDDPYISIAPAVSDTFALKEKTSDLLNKTDAVAGVNGDFFGVSGSYSGPLGLMKDGDLTAFSNDEPKPEMASFMLDYSDYGFIEYVTSKVSVLIDGKEILKPAAINKAFSIDYPLCITGAAASSTKDIDLRFPLTTKIIVENNKIVRISDKGETVQIPKNGFVLILNEAEAAAKLPQITVGKTAEIQTGATVDLSKIKTAISGAGKILTNGELAKDSGFVASGRQPRTALGLSRNGKELILMVVDGRTHSIGATQEEIAELLLEAGAYNAMHLDGGGSSTMAVRDIGDSAVSVVNTTSESAQRKVINALGVYESAPLGRIRQIVVETQGDFGINGVGLSFEVYGLDEFNHKMDLEPAGLTIATNSGAVFDGNFYPGGTGNVTITAKYGSFTAEKKIRAVELAQISPSVDSISVYSGLSKNITFTGTSTEGHTFKLPASSIAFEVVPSSLGTMSGNTFTCTGTGNGYLKCIAGKAVAFIPISSNLASQTLNSVNAYTSVSFEGYPESVTGSSVISFDNSADNDGAIRMNYSFAVSEQTQAAYTNFINPLQLPQNARGITLSVFGDNSGHWLRGRITDANGKQFPLDFHAGIDFDGYRDVTAIFPDGVAYPVKLDRIYAVSLSTSMPVTQTLYFDNIRALTEVYTASVEVPKSSVFTDNWRANGDITFYGIDMRIKEKPNGFTTATYGKINYISLNTINGGIASSDASQWSNLQAALKGDYIVIQVNVNPRRFTYAKEFELLRSLLKQHTNRGAKIMVVSNDVNSNGCTVIDGVRYVNIGSGVLSVKAYNDSIMYAFE